MSKTSRSRALKAIARQAFQSRQSRNSSARRLRSRPDRPGVIEVKKTWRAPFQWRRRIFSAKNPRSDHNCGTAGRRTSWEIRRSEFFRPPPQGRRGRPIADGDQKRVGPDQIRTHGPVHSPDRLEAVILSRFAPVGRVFDRDVLSRQSVFVLLAAVSDPAGRQAEAPGQPAARSAVFQWLFRRR